VWLRESQRCGGAAVLWCASRKDLAVSYGKDAGEVSARYRSSDSVPSVTYPSGTHVVFTAPGSATGGQYGLFEWNMSEARGGADPHFHKTFSEAFYVMGGTVRLFNGESWIDATRGDFLYVPSGGIHAFSNESGAAARMLILFAPGVAREGYFRELAEIRASGRVLTDAEWVELWARHDQYPVRLSPWVVSR
jgi:mannose-6-phosphate isomerase-like protein (cupin superfamily)